MQGTGRLLLAGLAVLGVSGCEGRAPDADLVRLSARVDSLAVTLTRVVSILEGRAGGAAVPESAVVAASGFALGSEEAPVTVVEFTDLECPFCRRHHQEVFPVLLREYVQAGKIRYVVRDHPLPFHARAADAARAARCVGAQSQELYWRFIDAVMADGAELEPAHLLTTASTLGVEPAPYRSCLAARETAAAIRASAEEAMEAGLKGTPAFVIGPTADGQVAGAALVGAYPFERFRAVIDEALASLDPEAS